MYKGKGDKANKHLMIHLVNKNLMIKHNNIAKTDKVEV